MRRALAGSFLSLAALTSCTAVAPAAPPPVVIADVPPPAVQGGGLFILSDGRLVVSDSDRDRVLVVDVAAHRVLREVALPAGSEPGRTVQSVDGNVHVVLRGAGAVASFSPTDTEPPSVIDVCPMPSGIALDDAHEIVLVACASGELVTYLSPAAAVASSHFVERDLRDVIVSAGHVLVTTFRSAELLEVDPLSGAVLRRAAPADASYLDAQGRLVPFRAAVAWRTIRAPSGAIVMLHQRARRSSIAVHVRAADTGVLDAGSSPLEGAYDRGGAGPGPDGSSPDAGPVAVDADFDCGAIVRSAITVFDPDTFAVGSGHATIADARLAVDIAVRDSPSLAAIASVGVAEGSASVHEVPIDAVDGLLDPDGCTRSLSRGSSSVGPGTVAVVYDAAGALLAFEREPAAIVVGGDRFELGGVSVLDTGHQLFHTTTSARIACASCHPAGREDGRVWLFDNVPRRTQTLAGGVLATAPFHWDGEEQTFRALVDDVLTRRMSGPSLTEEQLAALAAWVDQLPAPHGTVADLDAAARGRALFEGDAGCTACHVGPHLTDNRTVDVGRGAAQVPSLVGVAFRLPVLRDGCAHTLAQRFDPMCGGNMHGNTATLTAEQIGELVTYLETF